jgi:S-adenosylmethionine synthetase
VARRVAADHGAEVSIAVNAADDLASGRIYLTVLGTSAECGDDGQAGRGNRINGLITPLRPMTMESVAGKNAVTHVGKLYNLAAGLIAQRIVDELPGVVESQCLLVSAIGRPITEPQLAAVQLRLLPGASLTEQESAVAAIAEDEVGRLASAGEELASGRLRIGGWPLRAAIGPYSSV